MKNKNVTTFSSVGKNSNIGKRTLCYVAGRSGGHILPALTHAGMHLAKHPCDRIVFISTNTKLDKEILSAACELHATLHLSLATIPRSLWALPLFALRCGMAFLKSLYFLHRFGVDELVSMGGYISIPACLAARCLGVPITLFELNVQPGRATRFLAWHARSLHVCFEGAQSFFPKGTLCVPYPLRYQSVPKDDQVIQYMTAHGLSSDKKTIFLLGGSQGSIFLNTALGDWLDAMPDLASTVQILHQTGSYDMRDWQDWYRKRNITAVVFTYQDDLSLLYATADLIVCRAGAGTLFEIAFFNKPCIIIPLVTTETSHQVDNARAMITRYPELFSMLDQVAIENDPMILFSRLQNSAIKRW